MASSPLPPFPTGRTRFAPCGSFPAIPNRARPCWAPPPRSPTFPSPRGAAPAELPPAWLRGGRPRPPDSPGDRRDDVLRRVVVDGLGGVEPQAVDVELVHPVPGVGDEELADRARLRAVEVERLAPLR